MTNDPTTPHRVIPLTLTTKDPRVAKFLRDTAAEVAAAGVNPHANPAATMAGVYEECRPLFAQKKTPPLNACAGVMQLAAEVATGMPPEVARVFASALRVIIEAGSQAGEAFRRERRGAGNGLKVTWE